MTGDDGRREPAREGGDGGDGSGTLGPTRQATIDALCEHFANDAMEVEEFERRVEVAHRASSREELSALLRDLPGPGLPAHRAPEAPVRREPERGFRVTDAAHVKEKQFVVAVLGGATRKGRWTPARTNYALAVMGGAELDFREAVLAPGVTDVQVFAMWGGIDIIVPPGMRVESHGLALMGGFDHVEDVREGPDDPDAPVLRITGVALMGGVDITVRHPGESAREARRRVRAEQKRRRRLERGR
jgi:hypothetical protein